MIILKQAAAIEDFLQKRKNTGSKIGFVPTMGALHRGHLSLIESAKSSSDLVVCSIFVNPTQFNDVADFEKYPITLGEDIKQLEALACDVLFVPSVAEMYPAGTSPHQQYNLGAVEALWEGFYRPGHFQGVCQVVHRLLEIVKPDIMHLGQKDYQQYIVLSKLVELLQLPVQIVKGATIREPSGLAMSSRNMRLNEQEKQLASHIYRVLQYVRENITTKSMAQLEAYAVELLLAAGFNKVDYARIVDATTLQPIQSCNGSSVAVLVAAFINDVRLIDNIIIEKAPTVSVLN